MPVVAIFIIYIVDGDTSITNPFKDLILELLGLMTSTTLA